LASREPQSYEHDKIEHNDTVDSISWAENNLGRKLELPIKTKEVKKIENNSLFIDNYNLDDDEEIKSTLKSAHQAEWLFGYHGYAAGGYRGANEGKDYGKYVRQVGYTNGSKGNPWQDDHLKYGDDWWENWMPSNQFRDDKNAPKPEIEADDGNSTTFSTKSAIPGKKKKVMTEEGEDSNSTTTDVAKNKTDGVNEDPSSF
jgi:hypothetical protein